MRVSDWETKFNDYIDAHRDAEFQYGALDCARFVCGAVECITGRDLYAPYRNRYNTEIGAARALKRFGQGDLEATFAAQFDDRPIAYAQRGDIVFDGESVGLCIGRGRAVFIGDGLAVKTRKDWVRVWANG